MKKNKLCKSILALTCAVLCLSPTALFVACDSKKQAYVPPHPPVLEDTDTEIGGDNIGEITPIPPSENSSTSKPSAPENSVPQTPQAPAVRNASYIRCTGNNVNIRAGAGTDYAVLGSAEKGTMYAIVGKTGNWYKTYYRNKIAYIYAEYASVFTLEQTHENVEKVIEEGYKLLGVPYVYGAVRLHDGKGNMLSGFTTQKFDCSSLIQYIFYKGADKVLQVTTRTQVTQGKYVARQDLQRGDCIYFTNEERQYKTGVERVGHVALYLGNDYILHTASDYARIEKMSAKRWNFYIEARRFV